MAEYRGRTHDHPTSALQPEVGVEGDRAERQNGADVRERIDLSVEVRETAPNLLRRRSGVRWRPTPRRRNEYIRQLQPIVGTLAGWEVREAGAVERAHQ